MPLCKHTYQDNTTGCWVYHGIIYLEGFAHDNWTAKWGLSKTGGQRTCCARPSTPLWRCFDRLRTGRLDEGLSLWMLMNDVFTKETLPKITSQFLGLMKKTTSHKQDSLCSTQTTGFIQEQNCTYTHYHGSARRHEGASCTYSKHPAEPSGENMRRTRLMTTYWVCKDDKIDFWSNLSKASSRTQRDWELSFSFFLFWCTTTYKLTHCLRHFNHTFLNHISLLSLLGTCFQYYIALYST